MPDPSHSMPEKDWTPAMRRSYEGAIADARSAAIASGKPGVVCEASGSLASQLKCSERGCGLCLGVVAASAKQSELTGYDPANEKPTR